MKSLLLKDFYVITKQLKIFNLSPVILLAFLVILNVMSLMISMNIKKDKAQL